MWLVGWSVPEVGRHHEGQAEGRAVVQQKTAVGRQNVVALTAGPTGEAHQQVDPAVERVGQADLGTEVPWASVAAKYLAGAEAGCRELV